MSALQIFSGLYARRLTIAYLVTDDPQTHKDQALEEPAVRSIVNQRKQYERTLRTR